MPFVRATGAAALVLFVGTIVPVYAQRGPGDAKQGKDEKQQGGRKQAAPPAPQKGRPQEQSPRPQAGGRPQQEKGRGPAAQRPQQRVQQSQPQRPQPQRGQIPQQARKQEQPQRTRQQAMAWQQQRGWQQKGGWGGGVTNWQQGRAQHWDNEHRGWDQRGGYGGYFIPQDRFRLYFGVQHFFRMRARPTIYMGFPRFAYSGFSFLLVDPWPEYWDPNWYATDDVYIDYDGGYYLYNRRHPGVRLAVTVVL